jgi:3-phenylpropionate/trans-cinnamate dioxygenase ferredoxin subunit
MSETRQFVRVAADTEIAEGQVRVVEARGKSIAICRNGGKLYAIDNLCTHDNGPLGEGELIEGEIECPRHGARFDVQTGKAMCLPAVGYVETYAVDVRDGEIWVGLPAVGK